MVMDGEGERALLAGAIVTEKIFSWPGLGRLMVDAISNRDYALVQGCLLSIGLSDFDQHHQLRLGGGFNAEMQHADGDRQIEAARAAGTGIEVEHALFVRNRGPVRVAVEHGGELRGGGIQMQSPYVMQ